MDPLTHGALGAAVAGIIGSKREGMCAPIAGILAAASPDLDLVPTLFMDPLSKLDFHRGITHSVPFAILISPLIAYAIIRFTGKKMGGGKFLIWTLIILFSILSHILLDSFTTYGTRIFLPFSDFRAAVGSIAIADPFFSVPIIVAAVSIFAFKDNDRLKKIVFASGFIAALVYLSSTVFVKAHIDSVFAQNLKSQNIEYSRLMTTPMPFSNFFWVGIAEGRDDYFTGYHSVFDRELAISFTPDRKNHEYIADIAENPSIRTIIAMSKDFYAIEPFEGGLKLNDLRYGSLGADTGDKEYIISYDIRKKNGMVKIVRHTRSRVSPKTFKILIKRIIGIR